MTTIVLLLLIGSVSAWFWSLGSLPPEKTSAITLHVVSSGVSVREPLRTEWTQAKDGMTIEEGWSVKTDANGRATIAVGDVGESRLDSNSEVTLTTATLDAAGLGANMQYTLAAGRVWTRALRFFDLGSSYSVKTGAVVATVRGTAFDVAIVSTSTIISVADAAVSVVPVGGAVVTSTDAVATGMTASYAPSGRLMKRRLLTNAERNAEWFVSNGQADQAFDTRAVASRLAALKALGGVAPGSPFASLSTLSEQAHLTIAAKADREPLAERYAARRLMQLIQLVLNGKSGQASQEFARLENEMKSTGIDATARERVRLALVEVAPIIETADSNSPLFLFRQRLESLATAVSDAKGPNGILARLLAIEDRIDEAERFIATNAVQEAGIALDGAKSGIDNVVRESAPLMTGFTADDRHVIEAKIAGLRARVSAARLRLDTTFSGAVSADATSTSAIPTSPTSTPATIPSATSTATIPSSSDIVSIDVNVSPSPIPVGVTAGLLVTGTLADGSTQDVSAMSMMSVKNDQVARVNGLEITGVAGGSTGLIATYQTASGKTLTATTVVTVKGSSVPTYLSVTGSNGTAIAVNQATTFSATVRYSDGTRKVITPSTTFLMEPGSVGTLSGPAFYSSTPGTATVTATYTENGKTVTATTMITVTGSASGSNSTSSTGTY